ncbi:IclR family transcriptional regulator C-terminal domain-containing protein [Lipingzhangella sp. LS1_29]|uniref:IclR family transcriptional regulator C-terminal domain-containing protein n=1 Tax=Lipingzhangella rawalii TaxID=2055835 RepID=A0ABU2H6R2_9ACTN|nr:IclR family transcriptional regulator C-terminal domain-containing protein [Lipingzhangella rawalii]MDS1270540.1 IclR family transcriptional regulator C-terminal domain-containing protein [Lipingzhangella rawalii]
MRRETGPDFIEALARGLDVLRGFHPSQPCRTLSEVAADTGLARPTARRILLTLEELGYVRSDTTGFALTPRVLDLGMAYISSNSLWEIAEPHLRDLVKQTGESCSLAQLEGSDIVYVARVSVPKLVTLAVNVGTRFPAAQTSLGKVLLAALEESQLDRALATPSVSGIEPRWQPERSELEAVLRDVRAKGWASTDQDLALGIRSIAAPVRNGEGRTVAAVNVNAHAAETSVEHLWEHHLPLLLRTASALSEDWAARESCPIATVEDAAQ